MVCGLWRKTKVSVCFFFNDTATTEIYTLSLHDALPISMNPQPTTPILSFFLVRKRPKKKLKIGVVGCEFLLGPQEETDRKSTRLNSSHTVISYAVFCLKKKNKRRLTAWCKSLTKSHSSD